MNPLHLTQMTFKEKQLFPKIKKLDGFVLFFFSADQLDVYSYAYSQSVVIDCFS